MIKASTHLSLLLALAMGGGLFSAKVAAEPGEAAQEARAPDEIIKQAVTTVRSLIEENADEYASDKAAFYAMIEREIVPYFDLPYIARLVLGRHAREASTDQRRRFTRAFKNTLIRSYAEAMLEYSDDVDAAFDPLRMREDADQVTVNTRLIPRDGQDIPVGFVMHKKDGEWLIFDVNIEGISLVTNFRAQFNQRIRADGLDKLIERLEQGEIDTPALEG